MVSKNIKNSTYLPQQNQNLNQTNNSYNLSQLNQIKTLSTNLYDLSQPKQNLRINEVQVIINTNTLYSPQSDIKNLA